MNTERLLQHFDRIAEAPDAVAHLRRFILDLAVRGKLVDQDPNDEPASELLKRIQVEKERLVKEKKIRRSSPLSVVSKDDELFRVPKSWAWTRVGEIFNYDAGQKREPAEMLSDRWLLELEDIEKNTSVIIEKLTVADRDSRSTKSEFQVGDILYGKLRPYLNKVVVATEPGYSTTEIVAIRSFIPLCPDYCCLAFRRPDFVDYVNRVGQGTKMPRLRTQDALIAVFPLPPIAEQHRIVSKVDELMRLCDRLQSAQQNRESQRDRLVAASLHHLNQSADGDRARFYFNNLSRLTVRSEHIKQLRQAILNLAVCGKLLPQDPNDEPATKLLECIQSEKVELIKKGKIRKEKPLDQLTKSNIPFIIPPSWEWVKIGVASLFTEYGTSQQSAHSELGVPVLKMGDIQDGKVILGGQKKVPENIDDLPSLYLEKFDLLYNRTNSAELVGKTGIYLGNNNTYTFASYLIRIRCSKTYSSPLYFNLVMNSPVFRTTQIIPHLKQQCGQANVNGTILKNMAIPLPPLAEQHRIIAKVDELMALCDRLETQLSTTQANSRRLLESLLYEALAPS